MVTRAFIEEVIDVYKYRIRIPLLNKAEGTPMATAFENLYVATAATLPNCVPNYKVGDAVFISFENNSDAKPVILGQLSRKDPVRSNLSVDCDSLTSITDAHLPSYTYIGDVSPYDIKCLVNTKKNIQEQIDDLYKIVGELSDRVL